MGYISLLFEMAFNRLVHHSLWYSAWFFLLLWLAWLSWRVRTPDFFFLGLTAFIVLDEVYLFGWGYLKARDIIGYWWRDGRWYPSHELFLFIVVLVWLFLWVRRLSR